MVRRAAWPSFLALPIALLAGWALGGPGAGASAVIAIVIAFFNFAAHGLSLSWASTISVAFVQGVALAGFIVRLGVIVGALFVLNTLGWFSPVAFGLTVVPATMLLLGYEARLMIRGVGGSLQIPADPAAAQAGRLLAAREAR